jgi:hypothetical protein
MSSPSASVLPLTIGIAPFPEGFKGSMDETFQQGVQLMTAFVEGQFLTGVILPPGTTLPTSDSGMIFMGGSWYYWDATLGHYVAQTVSAKPTKNFARNPIYQVAQLGTSFTVGAGVTQTYDMALVRSTAGTVLAIATDVGPLAGNDNDLIGSALKYTVPGPTLVPTLAATDLYCHEHLIEGIDIAMLRGQVISLSFSVWASVAGTYSVYLCNSGRDSTYVANFTISAPQASSWVRIKIQGIPPFPTLGTWSFSEGVTGLYIGIVMAAGAQWQTTTPNAWQNAFKASTATNINMLTVINNQLKITGIKLEGSSGCSYLQAPSFQADYEDAIRYYFTTFNYQSLTTGTPITAIAHLTNIALFAFTFPRRMCKAPTVVPYGWTSHTAGNVTNVSIGTDFAVANLGSYQKGIMSSVLPTGTAKGDVILTIITADARLS